MSIFHLAQNEFIKITRKKGTLLSLFFLFLIVLLAGLIMNHELDASSDNNWKERLLAEKKQEEIDKPAETTGVYYSADVKNKDYYLEHNINPYEWNGWRFFGTVTSNGLEIFVSLTAILTVSGVVSKEFSLGTIKFIATSPNRRWRILTSKFLASLLFTGMIYLFYCVSCLLIGGVLFGFSNASYPLVYTHLNDSLYTISSIKASGIILLLRFISIISIVTIAFTLSVLCKSQALSLCLSILLLFAGSILGGTDLLAQFTWYKFTLFPHLNLVAYVNKSAGDAISTLNIPYSMTVIAIYFLICLLISFSVFQKRDITA
ncbi:ABC transporter permease [Bacillus velezensis]|uniref:ABC transporter permease n=1 Tax=Bacillus velezensis TaxID=492670 RepID=UPI001246F879|nr:ABC transporter permease [Bacillus velezensis]QEV93279.1 ABC transporter permease [Bacillus velezensis]WHY38364.1 ABC transporter permease [Bacillus velezensis]